MSHLDQSSYSCGIYYSCFSLAFFILVVLRTYLSKEAIFYPFPLNSISFFIIKLNYFKKWNQGRVIKLSVSPCRVKNESISVVALVGEGPKPTVEESSSQIIVFNSLSNHQSPIIFNN
jgi:hypothetical protein